MGSNNLIKLQFLMLFIGSSALLFGQNTLDEQFSDYEIVQVNTSKLLSKVQSVKSFPYFLSVDKYELEMIPSNIISSDYKSITTEGEFINTNRAIPLKGFTKDGLKARLTIANGFMSGFIEKESSTLYIEPASYYNKSAKADEYILYDPQNIKDTTIKTCGVDYKSNGEKSKDIANNALMVGLCYDIDYPVAADYSYVNKYGGASGAENQIITVINNINTDYDTDFFADQATFILSGSFLVSTSGADDPWTSNLDPGILLPDFRSWGNSFWLGQGIDCDVSSLWTNRDFTGSTVGLAYTGSGVVCTSFKYNVLQDFSSNANSIRVLTSHELGHNFSSAHDAAGSSHIMAPSVQNTNTWSAQSIASINAHIDSRTCLSACAAGSTPTIEFNIASSSVDEQSTTGSAGACELDFIDHQISIGLSSQPSSTITVTINISGGSATNNTDYSLQTTSVTFAPGQATNRTIDLHIFEDHKEESDETIQLSFTVTSGTADLGTNLTHTVSIINNQDGTLNGSPVTDVTYGNYNYNAGTIFIGSATDGRSRTLYSKEDLNAAGISAGNINALSLFIAAKNSTAPYNNFRIGLATTAASDLSSLTWIATTEVFQSNYTTSVGENEFTFNAPFYWDGNSSLYIQWCFNNTGTSADDVMQHSIPLVSNNNNMLHFQTLNGTDGCNPNTGNYSFYTTPIQPRMAFNYDGIGTLAESDLNAVAQTILNQGETANLFSSDFELISIISNTGNQDIGCLEASISTTGNGKSNANFGAGSYSNKTYYIEGANTTNYDLTLFYTDAELATWGSNAPTLNMVMSTVPLASATENDITIVTPNEVTQDVFGEAQVSYKGSFTGFSYFALTDVAGEPPVIGNLENANLVVNNSSNGLLMKSSNGQSRRISATNTNTLTTAVTTGDPKACLEEGDLCITEASNGLILRKPNGTYLKVAVNNDGALTFSSFSTLTQNSVRLDSGDFEIGQQNKGLVLKNAQGECWKMVINASGVVSTVQTACL